MNRSLTIPILAAALAVLLFDLHGAVAQDIHPSRRPSPVGIAKTHVGDAYVKVTSGRPYIRGRKIFGKNTGDTSYLVPFGEIWRTGANEATEITFTESLLIDGQRLEAGTYTIFTTPDEDEWTIHFSPHLGLDGTGRFNPATDTFEPVYDPSSDVLQIQAPVQTTSETTDQFTLLFEEEGAATHLVFRWENTEVRIPLREAS